MASALPYTYFQCPCTSETPSSNRRTGESIPPEEEEDAEDERNFDPRAPRANYSLYPLDHLLFCEDCQQIRCQRCVLDEIVTWFCPNCLFEVPSSTVKSEGNRCTRSCFQCPECVAPLSVTSLETPPTGSLLGSDRAVTIGPWVLSCSYCSWSSKEIGIKFDKQNGIYNQLSRIKNGGEIITPVKERRVDRELGRRNISGLPVVEYEGDEDTAPPVDNLDPETRFANLSTFYQSQISETTTTGSLGFAGEYGYGSPGALSRIMGLYTGGSYVDKKAKVKTGNMREANNISEGLVLPKSDEKIVQTMRNDGWSSTTTAEQRSNQPIDTRFKKDLRPVPYLLRTKRSKRCRTCRHILSKPESRAAKFKIRLLAVNYIPSMTIKPLLPPGIPTSATSGPGAATTLLVPLKPTQFLLTMKNPLFEPVKITLATPAQTPGRFSSKVTILCPQFEIGANTDNTYADIDDTLQSTSGKADRGKTTSSGDGGSGQAEAGKVWEKGRNWCSVVVEVVPASLSLSLEKSIMSLKKMNVGGDASSGVSNEKEEIIKEDEDVVEIPIFVRVEWDADLAGDDAAAAREVKEKKVLAYWCVLGVGRIAQQ